MFLAIDYMALVYTSVFLIMLIVAYFVVLNMRLEVLFKQGSSWQIRVAQVILAFIIAYLVTQGIMALINNAQI